MIRLNPLSVNEELLIGVAAAGAVAGLGWLWWKKNNPSITLKPGAQSITAKPGSTVTLVLPSGAKWSSVANAGSGGVALVAASGSSPYPIPNVTAGEIVNATYTDSAGSVQNATIQIASA